MTQEQLMKVKIKYLEDRIITLEKSIERLNKIVSIWKLGQEENNQDQGFKDIVSKDNGNELI